MKPSLASLYHATKKGGKLDFRRILSPAQFKTASIPITLNKGANPLVIKTNNQKNRDVLIWAINCVVE